MKGKCKYCGKALKDIANIRCDSCDYAWNDGRDNGKDEIIHDIRQSFSYLKRILMD